MQGNVLGQSGGGSKINGIIEEYMVASGGNVSAGDFVKFVNSNEFGEDTELDSTAHSTSSIHSTSMSAVALNESNVFLAYRHSASSCIYGVVCTINNTSIIAGNLTQLTTTGKEFDVSAVALEEDKIFVAYRSNGMAYALICTIYGKTILVGTSTYFNLVGSATVVRAVVLNNSKVFVVKYAASNSSSLVGMICTISGTTITPEPYTQLGTDNFYIHSLSVVNLTEDKVCIVYSIDSKNFYLYGMICTISGTTIIKGTNTQLGSAYRLSLASMTNNKVFLSYNAKNDSNLYGMICTISGTTIIKGTSNQLSAEGYVYSTILLTENKVFILKGNSSFYLCGFLCTIVDDIVTVDSLIQISYLADSGRNASGVALTENKVFISHPDTNDNQFAIVGGFANEIKSLESSSDTIGGIAKTSGSEGDTVKVIVPDVA